jgi:membrane protease YdiL (CAAX protease family)
LIKDFLISFYKHLCEDYRHRKYLPVVAFVVLQILLIYSIDFYAWKKNLNFPPILNALLLFGFYSLAYYPVVLWVNYSEKKNLKLPSRFWIISLMVIAFFALTSSVNLYYFLDFLKQSDYHYWLRKVSNNITPFLVFLLLFIFTWKKFFKNSSDGFLWTGKNFTWFKIIWPILVIIVPLIIFGSQLGGFQEEYPSFKISNAHAGAYSPLFQLLTFELAYSLDFYTVELVFRGALVLGLISVIGKNALLPMASLYVFIHYGKPPAETISSFFGGYLLGYMAIYSRSVLAGTILHVFLALMMEVTAIILFVRV